MLKRPLLIIVCSLLFLYLPFEFGWQMAQGISHNWMDVVLNVVMPGLVLWGLIRVTRIGWYTLVAIVSLWGIRDLALYYSQNHGSPSALFLHIFIYAISLAYFINPRVRRLYFDPKMRWWRTKPRYETHLPLMVGVGTDFQYRVLRNISEGGCFVETDAPFAMNERFDLSLPLPIPLNVSVLQTTGEVRWVSTQVGKTGMGVLFLNPDKNQVRALKEFVRNQL
ncbi:MAG: PilZ domain-containing protein [Deltaproteobacteria bacterium]|nr:PilZ domain-containing protein [Deltaproteobacteria bacterium]